MRKERIRLATLNDAEQILAIYRPYITDTTVTFEYDVPALETFRQRMESIMQEYPYLVYEIGETIVGYAYASKQRDRAAYQWNVELSVYFNHHFHGQGHGRKLCETLLGILAEQRVHHVYSLVTLPNQASEKLHMKLGFTPLCIFEKTGYKFANWHDVAWFQKQLLPHTQVPPVFLPIRNINHQQLAKLLVADTSDV